MWVPEFLPGVKGQRLEVNHSPLGGAEVIRMNGVIFLALYAFMEWTRNNLPSARIRTHEHMI